MPPNLLADVNSVGILAANSYILWRGARRVLASRWQTAARLPEKYFEKQRVLRGRGMTVTDGDTFHMDTRLRKAKSKLRHKELMCIRICGVDSPETAHFGKTGQAGGEEAKVALESLVLGRKIKVKLLARDQYHRAVAMAWAWHFPRWRNLSLEQLKNGNGVVYTGSQAEFGGMEKKMNAIMEKAQGKKRGIWGLKDQITPMEFKRRQKE